MLGAPETPASIWVDLLVFGLILLFVVGERFAQWPESDRGQFSGSPRDYIDNARYSTFFALYLLTFLLFVLVLQSLGANVVFQLMGAMGAEPVGVLQALMGDQTYSVTALALVALLNVPRISRYDELWRSKLQTWARIPRAVEDVVHQLRSSPDSFQPEPQYLERLFKGWQGTPDAHYWQAMKDRLAEEQTNNTLAWRYLRSAYLLLVIKDLGASNFNRDDVDAAERKLEYSHHVLPRLEEGSELYMTTQQDLNRLDATLCEALCKFVVRKYAKQADQYMVLKNYGLKLRIGDTRELRLLEPAALSTLAVFAVCMLTVLAYLSYRGATGGPSLELERWVRWSLGSSLSYLAALLIGVVFDRVSQAKGGVPGIGVYLAAVLSATLASYMYFNVVALELAGPLHRHLAFAALALTFGMMAGAVIRSLSTDTFSDRREIIGHATRLALVFAVLGGGLQALATVAFAFPRGGPDLAQLAGSAVFGAVKAGGIAFCIGYIIQEFIRRQLVAAMRSSPRRRHLAHIQATDGDHKVSLLITNISRTGLRVRTRDVGTDSVWLKLKFPFANVGARIVWRHGHTVGLAFDRSDPNLEQLKGYIRNRYGEFYA
ncbi:MAG: PilZ domain-containing protein [Marinobacter sp.]|nr:PilZ domain-containing protein [Marinobacter sp.]